MKGERIYDDHAEARKVVAIMKARFEEELYFTASDIRTINAYLNKNSAELNVETVRTELSRIYAGFLLSYPKRNPNQEERKRVSDFYLQELLKVEKLLKGS